MKCYVIHHVDGTQIGSCFASDSNKAIEAFGGLTNTIRGGKGYIVGVGKVIATRVKTNK